MKKNFYITTTLPYVNAAPHIGFASEIVYADARARYERSLGKEVVFNTGTDEHGSKIYQAAQERDVDPQMYVDEYAEKFDDLKNLLDLSYTHFMRTTDEHHKKAAQEMWRRVDANGFIYKKKYSVKYCVGCELEKTDSELEDGFVHFTQEKSWITSTKKTISFNFLHLARSFLRYTKLIQSLSCQKNASMKSAHL